jgi:uncharacterized protein (DUF2147 family)
MRRVGIAFAIMTLAAAVALGQNSPVGRWRTMDDASGQPKSVVTIREEGGKLVGTVEKVFDPYPRESKPLCISCQGDLKDKPIVGMRILWDLSKHDEEWSGGRIFDPDTGKSYKCSLLLDGGRNRLKVRGFLGMPLFGRTQYWLREN